MRHLHHPSASDPDRPVDSLWAATAPPLKANTAALEGSASCDVAVVGGGYTGLSAAYHLARDHGLEVRVLERGEPGWGASGRNGGFCCIGSTKLSHDGIVNRVGEAEARRFHVAQREAVDLVAEIAEAESLDIGRCGDGELEIAHRENRIAGLKAQQGAMRALFGVESTIYGRDEMRERGLVTAEGAAALHTPIGFGLHPLRYARGLAEAAARRGATLHGASGVEAWERDGGTHVLHTAGGTVRAARVIVATNGYTPEDLHPALAGRLLPALSSVVATRPLTDDELAAQGWRSHDMAFDSRDLLHYFRLLPDRRLLLGARGGIEAGPASENASREDMKRRLGRIFPALRDVEITHFWRGFVCLARDLAPHVCRLPGETGAIAAMAYHGNGVAMATWSGRAAARLAAGATPDEEIVPAIMRRPLPRFPLPALRLGYLRALYGALWIRDEFL